MLPLFSRKKVPKARKTSVMEGEKLANPFDRGGDDFLSFQSSTPQGSPAPGGGRGGASGGPGPYRPRRGKGGNRQDQWSSFGQAMRREEEGYSPAGGGGNNRGRGKRPFRT